MGGADDTSQAVLLAAAAYREATLEYEAAAVGHEDACRAADRAAALRRTAHEKRAAAERELLKLCGG